MTLRIEGISRKMKNKIAEHGNCWRVCTAVGNEYLIETLKPVHGDEPYAVWIKIGEDINILKGAENEV